MSRTNEADAMKSLKGQLSEREFRIGELENRVKDLFNEATGLDEKLRIANRNARVLEEENSNFHIRIKAVEKDEDISGIFPMQKEAMKLIQENDELRSSLAEAEERAKAVNGRSRESDNGAEKQVRALASECERMRKEREREFKELESTRFQCAELQKKLEDEQDTLKAARELWDQERDRYQQKIDELLDHHRRTDRSPVSRSPKPKGGNDDEPLEQLLLKEDVAQLEQKLKELQEKSWEKEKEWIRTEEELRKRIRAFQPAAQTEGRNDQALFQAMKEQIRALQEEIKALRNDRRSYRTAAADTESVRSASTTGGRTSAAKIEAAENWSARYEALIKENDGLRDQLDAARMSIFELQNAADEKAIACREAEVQLAALRKQNNSNLRTPGVTSAAPMRSASERSVSSRTPGSASAADSARTISELKQRVRELESELKKTKSAHEQKETISDVRIKEYKKQVDELLRETAALRSDAAEAAAADDQETGQGADSMDGVLRLTKDKRESVEEVMRLLEFAWDSDDESKRLLRRTKYQSAAMAGQDAAKDEEIRRLLKIIEDLENRLRGMEKKADDNDELKDAVNDLRKQIRGLNSENEKLRKKNAELEKGKDAAAKDINAKQKDANRRMEELQKEIDDLKRRLADSRRVASRPASPFESPRTPRITARRRTPEVTTTLSQLSIRSTEEQRRSAVPEGAHLAFTVVELSQVLCDGQPITKPGYVIIKLKSIKEKYKTSGKELASVIRFDETFVFYLAQPDQDVITLHVYYRTKNGSSVVHIGDACFSMATLYRGVPRQRIAPIVQNPGTKDARRAGMIEVNLQTDDFGKTMEPTEDEVEDEKARFNELVNKLEHGAPEKLHAADVYMASSELH